MKYMFVVEASISMHTEVEADSLKAAIKQAQRRGVQSLCHQCAHGDDRSWNTSGELDCEPASSKLCDVFVDEEELVGEDHSRAEEIWDQGR